MKILFYCDEYPPYVTGGIGTVVKVIAEQFAKAGNTVFIVGLYSGPSFPFYSVINGVHVYRLTSPWRNNRIRGMYDRFLLKLGIVYPKVSRELRYTEDFMQDLIHKEQIDILELTDYYEFNYSHTKRLKYRKFDIPTVLRLHGSVFYLESLKGSHNKYAKVNDQAHFSRCDYLSGVSAYAQSFVNSNFDTSNFISSTVIHNSLEDSFLLPQAPSSEGKKNILFIGKLIETKGCFAVVKAFNAIAPLYPDWTLSLVGGAGQSFAAAFLDPQFRDRVDFRGYCNRDQVKEAIDNSSFVCFPTHFETFSMVALEVMARGKALIFTNTTSGPELVTDGIDGMLVDPQDVDQIVGKMKLLIESEELRDELGRNALKTIASNYTVSKIFEAYRSFYESIL